jgi:hypothetical protein
VIQRSGPTILTWGSLAPKQANLTECLLSDIAQNAVSFSYQHPTYIDPAIEEKIRDRFPILLDKAHMKPGNERW